jgi:hypothetical protein
LDFRANVRVRKFPDDDFGEDGLERVDDAVELSVAACVRVVVVVNAGAVTEDVEVRRDEVFDLGRQNRLPDIAVDCMECQRF